MFVVFWRTTLLYLAVLLTLRFMGKRQIGELQPSELVTTIMISNIAAIPIENISFPLSSGVIPIVALACFEVITSYVTLKSRSMRKLIVGNPRIIIRDGKIDQKELEKLRLSIDDLMEQLRGNSVFNIDDVMFAVVETNGSLSVYQKFDARPATNSGLSLTPSGTDAPPSIVVNDGKFDAHALDYCNLSEEWLMKTLKREKCAIKDIFLMTCDRSAKYHIVLKEKEAGRS